MMVTRLSGSSGRRLVAFAPINGRLIAFSDRLAQLLNSNDIDTVIFRTSLLGARESGWGAEPAIQTKVLDIPELLFDSGGGFLTTTIRSLQASKSLREGILPDVDLLITFMDDFAESELLTKLYSQIGIPTFMIQEGFHPRRNRFRADLYNLAMIIRALAFPKSYSIKNQGLLSKYTGVWSDFGFRDQLIEGGKNSDRIFTLGYPFDIETSTLMPSSSPITQVLLAYAPLYPRYGSKKWHCKMWLGVITAGLQAGLKVLLKPHPRVKDECLSEIIDRAEKLNGDLFENFELISEASKPVEDFITPSMAFISPFSASAFYFMQNKTPTIFIRVQSNQNELLTELAKNDEIMMVKGERDLLEILNMLKREGYDFDSLEEKNRRSLLKLAGQRGVFEQQFVETVVQILESEYKG